MPCSRCGQHTAKDGILGHSLDTYTMKLVPEYCDCKAGQILVEKDRILALMTGQPTVVGVDPANGKDDIVTSVTTVQLEQLMKQVNYNQKKAELDARKYAEQIYAPRPAQIFIPTSSDPKTKLEIMQRYATLLMKRSPLNLPKDII